jgi:hypothetical protein
MTALLPSKQVLVELMDLVSHSPESAEYLSRNFKAVLAKRNMVEQFNGLIVKFEAFKKEVEAGAVPVTDVWGGKQPLSAYANASEQRVRTAEKSQPSTPIENVAIGIDFSAEGGLNRGYTVNNEPADEPETQRLDISFHAWLARQGLLFSAPFVYQATESGDIKTSDDGQKLRVNLDEFKQVVEAEDRGLKPYFNSHVHGVEVSYVKVKVPEFALEEKIIPAA